MRKYYQLAVDTESREAEVTIFGDITAWEWKESDVSCYTLAKELSGLDVDVIRVHINSYGGDVSEGLAIYNTLRGHRARVRTVCDGFACSAASVVFMAGEERVMNPASLLMIHNAWTCARGNADELRKAADDLEVISETAANAYREHVSISDEELKKLLDEETWITPEDALKMGFATEIAGEETTGKPSQSVRGLVFERLTGTDPSASLGMTGAGDGGPSSGPAGHLPPGEGFTGEPLPAAAAATSPTSGGDQEKKLAEFLDALCAQRGE